MAEEIMNVNESAITEVYANNTDFAIPQGFICTVDTSTLEGKLDVMNALNGAMSLSDRMNETLCVKNIITTSGVRSRTGEVCTNSYLILDDGTALFSQSDGVHRSVVALVAIFTDKMTGICDFGDGINISCEERQLKNGNTLKVLVPARG